MLYTLMIGLCMLGEPDCTEGKSPAPMSEAECIALVEPAIDTLAAEVLAAKFDREVKIYVACVEYTALS